MQRNNDFSFVRKHVIGCALCENFKATPLPGAKKISFEYEERDKL